MSYTSRAFVWLETFTLCPFGEPRCTAKNAPEWLVLSVPLAPLAEKGTGWVPNHSDLAKLEMVGFLTLCEAEHQYVRDETLSAPFH